MNKTCAHCGVEIPKGAGICDNCGMPVSEAPSPREASPRGAPIRRAPTVPDSPLPPRPSSPRPPPVERPPSDPPSPQEALRWEQPREEAPPLSADVAAPASSGGAADDLRPVPPRQDGRPRRGLLILGGGFVVALLALGIAVWALVPYFGEDDGKAAERSSSGGGMAGKNAGVKMTAGEEPPSEDPRPAPGYQLVKHESGHLSVEVPSEWETDPEEYADLEGNGVGESEGIGPSITASIDLYGWNNIGGQGPGVFFHASKVLAQRYTPDQLLDLPSWDFSNSCESGAPRRDFDRSPYSGRIQEWKNCGKNGNHDMLFVAATPASRECVLRLQIATYNEADREVARHILDTFEADCGGIA